MVLICASHNPLLCGSPALASPGAQRWGHSAFTLLDSLCFSLAPQPARLTPERECAALLTFQQVGARHKPRAHCAVLPLAVIHCGLGA